MSSGRAPFRRADPDRTADPDEAERDARRVRDRELQELDDAVRVRIGRRAARVGTASPYDLVAEALLHTIGDAVISSLASEEFESALRDRGYVVVPVATTPPEAPEAWLYDALDLMGAGGQLVDPTGRMEQLWAVAWRAGYAAARTAPEGS